MDPLVSIAWLADNLRTPDLVILDATLPPVGVFPVVDTKARYEAQHIPGAIFFDIEALSDHAASSPHMLPPPAIFADGMAALGVSEAMTIVVYEQEGVFSAPRAWWMLRTMGARNVHVLDGDLQAWINAAHSASSEPVMRPRTSFHATLDRAAVRSFEEVQALIGGGGQILDARSAGRFSGTAPEPRAGIRSGHMPCAVNVPFTHLVENGRLKNAEQLSTLFEAQNVALDQPVTTSCGSGITAAVLALGLGRCGAKQVSLYDGSWAEYAQQPAAVIA